MGKEKKEIITQLNGYCYVLAKLCRALYGSGGTWWVSDGSGSDYHYIARVGESDLVFHYRKGKEAFICFGDAIDKEDVDHQKLRYLLNKERDSAVDSLYYLLNIEEDNYYSSEIAKWLERIIVDMKKIDKKSNELLSRLRTIKKKIKKINKEGGKNA